MTKPHKGPEFLTSLAKVWLVCTGFIVADDGTDDWLDTVAAKVSVGQRVSVQKNKLR